MLITNTPTDSFTFLSYLFPFLQLLSSYFMKREELIISSQKLFFDLKSTCHNENHHHNGAPLWQHIVTHLTSFLLLKFSLHQYVTIKNRIINKITRALTQSPLRAIF